MSERSHSLIGSVVVGFGAAVWMWSLGFFARMEPLVWPAPVLLGAFLASLAASGFIAARETQGGMPVGALTGVVTALINLLILGGLVSGERPNTLVPAAALWVPGSILVSAGLGGLGGAFAGRSRPTPQRDGADWTARFARIAAIATLILVVVGGLVTSHEAGLAVVDWPNSYGYSMFLYPLSRMVGGIYYEHAHRLFGTLVGLTTLALTIRVIRTRSGALAKALAAVALLLVVGQGILGGLRVTGQFTLADSAEFTQPNLTLAMVHGVTGQIFFAWMVALAAVTSRTWRERRNHRVDHSAAPQRILSLILIGALLVQLLLGVRVRHLGQDTLTHITFAVVVLVAAVLVGARVLGKYDDVVALRKSAAALLGHVGTQIVLGLIAYILVMKRAEAPEPSSAEIVVATAHQTVGALLLANATLLVLWSRRLLSVPDRVPVVTPSQENA